MSDCQKCGKSGHSTQECVSVVPINTGGKCINCGGNHPLRDCKEPRPIERRPIVCFTCNQTGHIARICPNNARGGPQGDVCYNCGKTGHISRDCQEPRRNMDQMRNGGYARNAIGGGGVADWEYVAGGSTCYNCAGQGHISRDCPIQRNIVRMGGGPSSSCYNCGEAGHISRECPKAQR